jgi:hypothetical protein
MLAASNCPSYFFSTPRYRYQRTELLNRRTDTGDIRKQINNRSDDIISALSSLMVIVILLGSTIGLQPGNARQQCGVGTWLRGAWPTTSQRRFNLNVISEEKSGDSAMDLKLP